MTVILILIVGVVAVATLWLLRQGVMTKPWLETGMPEGADVALPTGRVGLGILMVVLGALFALFGSAFVMRMDLEAWSTFTLPRIVWLNVVPLVLASAFLHRAARTAAANDRPATRQAVTIAALATAAFLVGQLASWRDLTTAGEGLVASPAASFFYLLSGLHGLHVLGGIAALALVLAGSRGTLRRRRTGIGLCATYWDFLLLVWCGLLVLFLGWANQLAALCRGLVS
ncbi:cytochrome c oxidase subunit 3 [Roseivivax sp. CAU 1761]